MIIWDIFLCLVWYCPANSPSLNNSCTLSKIIKHFFRCNNFKNRVNLSWSFKIKSVLILVKISVIIVSPYLGAAEKVFRGGRVWGVGCGVWGFIDFQLVNYLIFREKVPEFRCHAGLKLAVVGLAGFEVLSVFIDGFRY